nr:LysE family translocator [uncultured Desulfobacter sp.]
MMTVQLWIMYLTFVFAATATPGPAVLFITTNSLLYGWKKTIFAALGNIIGLFCLGVIAITGLGAILKMSVLVYGIIKYLGASYLIYLGLKLIFQKHTASEICDEFSKKKSISSQKLFYQAFLVAVSNPKAIVFLTALFPQFINHQRELYPQFAALIAILMIFSFLFLLLYSMIADRAKGWISKPGRIKIINRISGSLFVGFGALLATSSNK